MEKYKITELVFGHNINWKENIDLGIKTNRQFCAIPHCLLIKMLKYKCNLLNISFKEQNEAYTSKCDALMLEDIIEQKIYSGIRIEDEFISGTGITIHADVNGQINIARKSMLEDGLMERLENYEINIHMNIEKIMLL